jgi:hypothetical protein
MSYVRSLTENFTVDTAHRDAANAAALDSLDLSRADEVDPDDEWGAVDAFLSQHSWESIRRDDGGLSPYFPGVDDSDVYAVLKVLAPFVVAGDWCEWHDEDGDITVAKFDHGTVTYLMNIDRY